jgi:hypothetical protein
MDAYDLAKSARFRGDKKRQTRSRKNGSGRCTCSWCCPASLAGKRRQFKEAVQRMVECEYGRFGRGKSGSGVVEWFECEGAEGDYWGKRSLEGQQEDGEVHDVQEEFHDKTENVSVDWRLWKEELGLSISDEAFVVMIQEHLRLEGAFFPQTKDDTHITNEDLDWEILSTVTDEDWIQI